MTDPRRQLERDIEGQLRWGPKVHAPPVVVAANPDAGTLLDAIDLRGEACTARDTARRVVSAAATAQDATVRLFTEHIRRQPPRSELAVTNQVLVPTRIGLTMQDGSVTLEGQITWNYRRDAERAIQYLSAAIGLRALEPQHSVSNVKENVDSALKWLSMDAAKE